MVNERRIDGPARTRSGDAGVVFDLDGTLVDSNYLHTLAWVRTLRAAGETVDSNVVHRLIGMGSDQLLPRLIGRTDDAIADARDAEYGRMIDEVVAFDGAEALLRAVRAAGLRVVLATSSTPADYERLVGLIGGADLIDAHTTIDDVRRSKPAPEIFERAVQIGGLDPRRTVVVGDSRWDVEAATAAGLACLAVESGGTSRAELVEAGAFQVFAHVAELRDRLAISAIGQLAATSTRSG